MAVARVGDIGGNQSTTLVQGNLPGITLTTNVSYPGHSHVINGATANAGNAGVLGSFVSAIGAGGSGSFLGNTVSAFTGIPASTPRGGSSTPASRVQPAI